MTFFNKGGTAVTRKALPGAAGDKQKAIVVIGAVDATVGIDFVNGKGAMPARPGSRAKKINPIYFGRRQGDSFPLRIN
jgi:hypothetical protein